jgi:hypothetical protein
MKTYLVISTLALSMVASAYAGSNRKNPDEILSCKNKSKQTFRILNTAVVTMKQGVLDLNQGGKIYLSCPVMEAEGGPGVEVLWNCSDDATQAVVRVETGGITGNKVVAYPSLKQVFPLPDKALASPMVCK